MKNAPEKLVVEDLDVIYEKDGRATIAVKELSFKAKENEFLCLLGPTGCGKTTTLNAIAGFIKPAKGKIFLDKKEITAPTKETGIVFQHYALFPWKTARENISIGPKINGLPEHQIETIVNNYLQLIGLRDYANHYPNELSGGMQQRVGLARALANTPEILLMDEPFGSLDALTRIKMQEQLLRIWEEWRKTIIFVTHDTDEAILLGDRILIMTKAPGKIKKEIKNDLPRPRSYKLVTDKNYIRLKREIIGLLD
jgi:NitT/TauT family transport system ATP-binding protein